MKKLEIKTWLGLLIIGTIASSAGLVIWQAGMNVSGMSMPSSSPMVQPQEAELFIDFGNEKIRKFRGGVVEDMKVLDALNQSSIAGNFKVETADHESEVYVEKIAGVENSNHDVKWVCYVNGEVTHLPLDEQELKARDRVEFKFEKMEE